MVVGIVTRSNLMHAMVSLARVAQPAAGDDAAIRERLLAEIQKEQWAPVATINVVVHDGVVELWGVIIDERQRTALKVAAENIPGVKAVKDHLVWVEPTSGVTIEPAERRANALIACVYFGRRRAVWAMQYFDGFDVPQGTLAGLVYSYC